MYSISEIVSSDFTQRLRTAIPADCCCSRDRAGSQHEIWVGLREMIVVSPGMISKYTGHPPGEWFISGDTVPVAHLCVVKVTDTAIDICVPGTTLMVYMEMNRKNIAADLIAMPLRYHLADPNSINDSFDAAVRLINSVHGSLRPLIYHTGSEADVAHAIS